MLGLLSSLNFDPLFKVNMFMQLLADDRDVGASGRLLNLGKVACRGTGGTCVEALVGRKMGWHRMLEGGTRDRK